MLSLPAALALGYFIGSVPVAYLVVRWKSRIDIRHAGSGNVGTLNSFLVTGSKLVGALVLVLDLLKGVLAVWAAGVLFAGAFEPRAMSAAGAVLGHNYPVWLSFRGGRGLATAAGACLAISWPIVPLWLALWGGAHAWLRSVNPANALATFLILLGALALPGGWIGAIAPDGITEFRLFAAAVMAIILARHVSPVLEFVNERRMAKKH